MAKSVISEEKLIHIAQDVDKIKKKKAVTKKRQSTSTKPLKFEVNVNDSPLKAAIIDRINARDLTYADIYKYCTEVKGGDVSEGQRYGYNIISGLKTRPSMIDTTFSLLCDFLNLDIMLVERKSVDDVE